MTDTRTIPPQYRVPSATELSVDVARCLRSELHRGFQRPKRRAAPASAASLQLRTTLRLGLQGAEMTEASDQELSSPTARRSVEFLRSVHVHPGESRMIVQARSLHLRGMHRLRSLGSRPRSLVPMLAAPRTSHGLMRADDKLQRTDTALQPVQRAGNRCQASRDDLHSARLDVPALEQPGDVRI